MSSAILRKEHGSFSAEFSSISRFTSSIVWTQKMAFDQRSIFCHVVMSRNYLVILLVFCFCMIQFSRVETMNGS